MRLLRIDGVNRFSLVEFTGQDIPPYAILSHTWGADSEEVTYLDMVNQVGRNKIGYQKIRFCAIRATHDNLNYFWVDTCCIDKSSSAELTESINSMFRWYKEAAVCYVTLTDLRPHVRLKTELPRCRWFTRGWTLQELLAPRNVQFYDVAGTYVGSKQTLAMELSRITGVNETNLGATIVLSGSVATKMFWAARRETKRIEDRAYSMLGIFDVSMPLIYGEGTKAFQRLQQEIIKQSNDLTVFAWSLSIERNAPYLISSLATTPADFKLSHPIESYAYAYAEFSLTNKGLLLSEDVPLRIAEVASSSRVQTLYIVLLGRRHGEDGGIVLRKIGPKLFCRDGSFGFETDLRNVRAYNGNGIYLLLNSYFAGESAKRHRENGLHIPLDPFAELRYTYPDTLWDESDRMFLRPKGYNWATYLMVLVMKFNVKLAHAVVPLVVLCHAHPDHGLVLKAFNQDQYPQEFDMISQAKYREDGIHVQELDLQAPSIRGMGTSTRVNVGDGYSHISVSLRPGKVQTSFGRLDASALSFAIDGRDTKEMFGSPIQSLNQM